MGISLPGSPHDRRGQARSCRPGTGVTDKERGALVLIQRSAAMRGVQLCGCLNRRHRETWSRDICWDIVCFVDSCYGALVEEYEPLEAGSSLVAGSLIKNPGGFALANP